MSDSQRPHELQPSRLLCPWDFPGKSTGVGCHCLLQRITADSLEHLQLVEMSPHSLVSLHYAVFWRCLPASEAAPSNTRVNSSITWLGPCWTWWRRKRVYRSKEKEELVNMYWQGPKQLSWVWILVFEQGDQNVKQDKQEWVDLGTMNHSRNSRCWCKLTTKWLRDRWSSVVHDLLVVRGNKEAEKSDCTEMINHVRPEESPDDYVLQDRPRAHSSLWSLAMYLYGGTGIRKNLRGDCLL